jgi:hypothetical protein
MPLGLRSIYCKFKYWFWRRWLCRVADTDAAIGTDEHVPGLDLETDGDGCVCLAVMALEK